VLIYGESGTGKELYAQAIHNASERRNGPFIAINCATFDHQLLESELFGYEEGAFTGAKKGGKIGLFEIAEGGTLFLDEISEMNYTLQARLLRVLQERLLRRVGGVEEIPLNVRVISATNVDLEHMIHEHTFRKDLYYRIAVFPIRLTPLRNRREDIVPLAETFAADMSNQLGQHIAISEDVKAIFNNYLWHGNIRELKNTIEFAANLMEGGVILPVHLPSRIQNEAMKQRLIDVKPLHMIIGEVEVREIEKAIMTFGDSLEGKRQAAKALGISLATLYNKMKKAPPSEA
jgi:transcriptional regulator with PAS, ATPase and Fis domain